MRIILYAGKGGVGKTTVAAATALRCAQLGRKTMVMSTDPAHSLGDAFDLRLSGEAKEIAPQLWAQEVDILREIDVNWGSIQNWITALLAWRGLDDVLAQEMAILPGMEELVGLLYILQYHDEGLYDVVIVDCAPTGETLRLLSFPEVLRWWMERVFPIERRAAQVLRPLMRPWLKWAIPEDEVFEAAKDLFARIDRMRSILIDAATSSVRLVLNPEKMVIKEAQRTYTYLQLYGYATDLVVCNRLLPALVSDPYFAPWRESQVRYEQAILEAFSPLPILRVPLMEQEVVGIPMLHRMAEALYGQEDPAQLYYQGPPREIEREGGAYVLTLPLPFVERQDISLTQTGDELIVHVGNQRRNIILPRALAGMRAKAAKLEQERLQIRFSPRREGQGEEEAR